MRSHAQEVLDELRKVIDALDAGVSEASAKAGKQVSQSLKGAQSQIEALKRQVQELSQGVVRMARAADESVHERPWESLAVAVAVAFLAGLLLARRAGTGAIPPSERADEARRDWPGA